MGKKHYLKTYLTWHLILAAFIPILIVGFLSYSYLIQKTTESIQIKNELLAKTIAGEVKGILRNPLIILHQLNAFISSHKHHESELNNTLDLSVHHFNLFESIYLLDKNGKLSGVGLKEQLIDKREDFIGLDFSNQKFFKKAKTSGQPVWSDIFLSTITGHVTLTLSWPFDDKILVGNFSIENLYDLTKRTESGEKIITSIVDRKGTLIFHPDKVLVDQHLNMSNITPIRKALKGQMGTYHYDLDDISYIGSIASIPETGWLVLVSQTTDNAYAYIQTVRIYFMAGLIIAIFLVAVLAISLSKTLIRPLSELRSSTKDISGGKYDSIVPTYSYEEIEDLATSFREMTSIIQNRENRLLISEERFRSLVHTIRSGIVVHAADTSIIQSNAMAQKMFGLTEEQMMGKTANDTHWQFCREDGSNTPLEEYPINQVIATRKLLEDHVIGVYNPESDDVVWLLVNAVPEFTQTGELSQVIVTFIDITRRKKAEIALFESEEKYRRFFTTVPSGWAYHKIIVNENNKPVDYIFLEVNEAFEKATGLNKDIIIGKKVTDVITEIQDVEPDLISMYGEVALTGKDKLFELYFKPFNKWYSVNVFSNKISFLRKIHG